jgi:hypothetical protein
VHRDLNRYLRQFVNGEQKDWDVLLPTFEMVRRSSDIRDFGVSQAAIRYGRELRLPTEILLGNTVQGKELEWIRTRRRAISRAVEILTQATRRQREKDRRIWKEAEKTKRDKALKVGEAVMLYTPSVPSGLRPKMTTMWRGPYRILEQTSGVNYRIRHVLLRDKPTQVVHVDRLKRYYPRQDGEAQLQDYAAAKQLELRLEETEGHAFGLPVEKIVAHRLRTGRSQFKIRWQGYPAQQDTWEDAESLEGISELVEAFMERGTPGVRAKQRPGAAAALSAKASCESDIGRGVLSHDTDSVDPEGSVRQVRGDGDDGTGQTLGQWSPAQYGGYPSAPSQVCRAHQSKEEWHKGGSPQPAANDVYTPG